MFRVHRERRTMLKVAASLVIAAAIFGVAPPLARATLITSAGTNASSAGNGFTAYTHASHAIDLDIESDAYSGGNSYNFANSGSGVSYVEIYAAVPGCSGTFSVSSQHRAHDPVTGEYDFASSSVDGSCGGGGGGGNPDETYCRNMWSQPGAQDTNPYGPAYVDPNICPR